MSSVDNGAVHWRLDLDLTAVTPNLRLEKHLHFSYEVSLYLNFLREHALNQLKH